MEKFLIVVGCQPEKLALCGRDGRKIVDWVMANQSKYDGTISIIRKDLALDNFNRMGDTIANKNVANLSYYTDKLIEVPGYDVDCNLFRKISQYDIVGISTSASVLCIAMSMFSHGHNVRVLEKHCTDRKGKKLHEAAVLIMKTYMPIGIV